MLEIDRLEEALASGERITSAFRMSTGNVAVRTAPDKAFCIRRGEVEKVPALMGVLGEKASDVKTVMAS